MTLDDKDGYPPRFVDQQGLVGSSSMLLYLHRDRRDQGICRSMVGPVRDGSPGRPGRLSHSS